MRRFFLTLLFLAAALPAIAGDFPRLARIAAGPGGELFGGYQLVPGIGGEFELFVQTDPEAGGKVGKIGRFNGRLAGVVVDPSGRKLALTLDGALGAYGDDQEALALPDARWHMLDLAWFGDGPVALHYADGQLRLARPVSPRTWSGEEVPIVRDVEVAKAELIPVGDELHLLWNVRAEDLSRGALRHMAFRNGRWSEFAPLPIGDVQSFAVFRRGDGLALAAAVPDPLGGTETRVVARTWSDGVWSEFRNLDAELEKRLAQSHDFAGVAVGERGVWLTAGPAGAFLVAPSATGRPGAGEVRLAPGLSGELGWSEVSSLALTVVFVVLLLVYCRRSRAISRLMPGRPPDLTSRAVALMIDWVLVSVAMAAYHFASGDMRIYVELLTLGSMNELFWINLAVFALYATALEGLYGRTPGKRLAGLRVRSVFGGPPAFLQVLLRNTMRGVDMFPLVFPGLLGAVTAMLNLRRQRVGDILSGTMVRRHAPIRSRKFFLASASPRRRELMEALGYDFRAEAMDIDEDSIREDTPADTARNLAVAKSRMAAGRLATPGEIVIAADTMVVLDGAILGKPKDAGDAARMLSLLSGRSHTVLTGVSVWDSATGQGLSDVEETEVEFRELSQREIDEYVASGDPMDKAGAYGVQSGFLVKQIRGSFSNVAGLPMEMLQGMLGMLDS